MVWRGCKWAELRVPLGLHQSSLSPASLTQFELMDSDIWVVSRLDRLLLYWDSQCPSQCGNQEAVSSQRRSCSRVCVSAGRGPGRDVCPTRGTGHTVFHAAPRSQP